MPYLTLLVVLYALSILSMTVYTQLMAYMTQGFLHKLRCEMFGGMQKLPIRYFDSHQHGDIMSHYTNDSDTPRQLVSQEAIYLEAKNQANDMVRAAQDKIKELKKVTNDYVDDSLRRTEEAVAEALSEIRNSRSKFRALVNPQAKNNSAIIEDV